MIFLRPQNLADILKPLNVRFIRFLVCIQAHLIGKLDGKFNVRLPLGSNEVSINNDVLIR